MAVNHILTDLEFSKDIKIREEALESLTRRIAQASVTTRQALSPFAVDADPHQDAVIKSSGRTIRMVAPAGAGKTQTVINRVLYRVQNGLKPARTLRLTFDRAGCKGAATISTKNLIKYNTREEAIAAGKKPCSECKP